ncbi:MAG: EamA family transporter [Bacteroidales bacterium]|nr:EamA family transporter [Bacteroidales bacterium]
MNKKTIFSVLIFLFLVLVWGSSFILIKKSLQYLSPLSVGMLRVFFTFIFLVPVFFKYIRQINVHTFFYALLAGFVGNFFPAILYAFAQKGVDSYVAGVLNSTTTLFALIVGILFFKFRSNWIQWIGVMIGFLGVIGLLLFAGDRNVSWNLFHGSMIILATIMYGFNLHIIKRYLSFLPSPAIVSIAFSLPGLVSLIVLSLGDGEKIILNQDAWQGVIYVLILAWLGSAIALILYYYLIKIASVIFSASVTYVMPIVSLCWGIWDGERIGLTHILMIFVILCGVFLANLDVFFRDCNNKIAFLKIFTANKQ